jgi:hypothetical protein
VSPIVNVADCDITIIPDDFLSDNGFNGHDNLLAHLGIVWRFTVPPAPDLFNVAHQKIDCNTFRQNIFIFMQNG